MAVAATTEIGARPSRAARRPAVSPATSFVAEFVGLSNRPDPVLVSAGSAHAGRAAPVAGDLR